MKKLFAKVHLLLFYIWHEFIVWSGGIFRRMNIVHNSKYKEIKNYKNRYQNARCFIIGTGPSLRVEDLDKLKGEITFASNAIFRSFDKTCWRPTYYMIEDGARYLDYISESKDYQFSNQGWFGKTKIFLSDSKHSWPICNLEEKNACFYAINTNYLIKCLFPWLPLKFRTRFGTNIYAYANNAGTVSYTLTQLAVYMGIKEIYLLGMDCNYMGSKTHFGETRTEKQHYKNCGMKNNADTSDSQVNAWKIVNRYAKKNNIKIYNLTRGGNLEVFPRINFDEFIIKYL